MYLCTQKNNMNNESTEITESKTTKIHIFEKIRNWWNSKRKKSLNDKLKELDNPTTMVLADLETGNHIWVWREGALSLQKFLFATTHVIWTNTNKFTLDTTCDIYRQSIHHNPRTDTICSVNLLLLLKKLKRNKTFRGIFMNDYKISDVPYYSINEYDDDYPELTPEKIIKELKRTSSRI